MPPLTEQQEKDLTRAENAFWERAAAAGVGEYEQYSWKGMYRSNAENAEAMLTAHKADYVPPVPLTGEEVALAAFGLDPFKDPEKAATRDEKVRAAARARAGR